jgi:hypothetical protein
MTSQKQSKNEERGQVLPFRPRASRSWNDKLRLREPRSPVNDLSRYTRSPEQDDYRHQMFLNLLAFLVLSPRLLRRLAYRQPFSEHQAPGLRTDRPDQLRVDPGALQHAITRIGAAPERKRLTVPRCSAKCVYSPSNLRRTRDGDYSPPPAQIPAGSRRPPPPSRKCLLRQKMVLASSDRALVFAPVEVNPLRPDVAKGRSRTLSQTAWFVGLLTVTFPRFDGCYGGGTGDAKGLPFSTM